MRSLSCREGERGQGSTGGLVAEQSQEQWCSHTVQHTQGLCHIQHCVKNPLELACVQKNGFGPHQGIEYENHPMRPPENEPDPQDTNPGAWPLAQCYLQPLGCQKNQWQYSEDGKTDGTMGVLQSFRVSGGRKRAQPTVSITGQGDWQPQESSCSPKSHTESQGKARDLTNIQFGVQASIASYQQSLSKSRSIPDPVTQIAQGCAVGIV